MGRNFTSEDEVKQDHIDKLGDELGSIYHELWNEVAWLHSKWDEYVELFGTKPSRVKLLNEAAPLFFRTVEDSLWESILVHITRLTDPPRSCGKDNLSIQRLTNIVDDEIKEILIAKIEEAKEKSNFCRDWRNRRIAHKDLGLVLDSQAEPLESASCAKVKDALQSIASVLNVISGHYMDATIAFELVRGLGGAVALLYILDDGLRTGKKRNERFRTGKYSSEDLKHRAL
jgi:hypothetical protein